MNEHAQTRSSQNVWIPALAILVLLIVIVAMLGATKLNVSPNLNAVAFRFGNTLQVYSLQHGWADVTDRLSIEQIRWAGDGSFVAYISKHEHNGQLSYRVDTLSVDKAHAPIWRGSGQTVLDWQPGEPRPEPPFLGQDGRCFTLHYNDEWGDVTQNRFDPTSNSVCWR